MPFYTLYFFCRVLGFDFRRGLGIFLFPTASRTALGPTQPPVQLVPGVLSLGVKRPERESDHSPPSSTEVKECVEIYIHSPNTPSWCGAQLKKSTGTTLPLPFTFKLLSTFLNFFSSQRIRYSFNFHSIYPFLNCFSFLLTPHSNSISHSSARFFRRN
jgi:hypothetical protein